MMAGVPGLEPGPAVLETVMLTIDTMPLRLFWILDFGFWTEAEKISTSIQNRQSKIQNLFIYFLYAICDNDNVYKTF